jgi:hypothetical protein
MESGTLIMSTTGNLTGFHAQRIQKVITTTAIKLQTQNRRGCHYIEAINEYMAE